MDPTTSILKEAGGLHLPEGVELSLHHSHEEVYQIREQDEEHVKQAKLSLLANVKMRDIAREALVQQTLGASWFRGEQY